VAYDAEEGLAGLGRAARQSAAPERPAPAPVEDVARAITRMRAAAGVG
jgi:hypothetical protein